MANRVSPLRNELARLLGAADEIVISPDHPFLLFGPDLLVGNDRGLFGIFIMHAVELKRPDELLIRMSLARLGYPDEFKAILVTPPGVADDVRPMHGEMRRQFNAVFAWEANRELSRQLRSGLKETYKFPSLRQQRATAHRQASVLYSETANDTSDTLSIGFAAPYSAEIGESEGVERRHIPRRRNTPPRKVEVPLWPFQRKRKPLRTINSAKTTQFKSWATTLSPQSTVQSKVARAGRWFFQADHALDNGIPYRQRAPLNVLFVDRVPEYRFDPEKWIRAAAFAGFAMMVASNPDVVSERLDRLERRLKVAR